MYSNIHSTPTLLRELFGARCPKHWNGTHNWLCYGVTQFCSFLVCPALCHTRTTCVCIIKSRLLCLEGKTTGMSHLQLLLAVSLLTSDHWVFWIQASVHSLLRVWCPNWFCRLYSSCALSLYTHVRGNTPLSCPIQASVCMTAILHLWIWLCQWSIACTFIVVVGTSQSVTPSSSLTRKYCEVLQCQL